MLLGEAGVRVGPLRGLQREIAVTETLEPGRSITDIDDGGSFALPRDASANQTNLFFEVARVGQLFVKVPTERGLHDYRTFIRDGLVTDLDVRSVEPDERPDRLQAALGRFPELSPIAKKDSETAHYLVVHKLQFERLRAAQKVGIPEARFATIAMDVGRGFSRADSTPAIIQQRVPGSTLWDMFDFEARRIRPAWQPFKPLLAARLSALMTSEVARHIDWNIKNFVFHGAEQELYYVDSKPTTFVAKSTNDVNLEGIRTHFLQ